MPVAPEHYSPSVILKAEKHFQKARYHFEMAARGELLDKFLSLVEESKATKGRSQQRIDKKIEESLRMLSSAFDKARWHCVKGLELFPLNAEAWWMLAVVSQDQGRERQLEYCNNALEIDPEYAQAWATKSTVVKSSKEAEECKRRAIELGFPSSEISGGSD